MKNQGKSIVDQKLLSKDLVWYCNPKERSPYLEWIRLIVPWNAEYTVVQQVEGFIQFRAHWFIFSSTGIFAVFVASWQQRRLKETAND